MRAPKNARVLLNTHSHRVHLQSIELELLCTPTHTHVWAVLLCTQKLQTHTQCIFLHSQAQPIKASVYYQMCLHIDSPWKKMLVMIPVKCWLYWTAWREIFAVRLISQSSFLSSNSGVRLCLKGGGRQQRSKAQGESAQERTHRYACSPPRGFSRKHNVSAVTSSITKNQNVQSPLSPLKAKLPHHRKFSSIYVCPAMWKLVLYNSRAVLWGQSRANGNMHFYLNAKLICQLLIFLLCTWQNMIKMNHIQQMLQYMISMSSYTKQNYGID